MPWMPEVFTAPLAAARRTQDEEATSTNDAVPYFEGILADEPDIPRHEPPGASVLVRWQESERTSLLS